MKDDLHKDKLEDFLRKSLEGHSEAPPSDMWSKIAANLEPPVAELPTQSAPRLRVLRNWWSVAAAAAVVVGLLVGQHLYFNGQINKLNEALKANATQLKQMEQQWLVVEEKKQSEQTMLPIEGAQEGTTAQGTAVAEPKTQVIENQKAAAQGSAVANAPAISPKQKKQRNGTDAAAQNTPTAIEKSKVPTDDGTIVNQEKTANTVASTNAITKAPAAELATAKQTEMPLISGLKLTPIDIPAEKAPLANAIIPVQKQIGTRLSIGLQTMPMFTKAEIRNIREDRDPHGGPGGPFDKHKSFKLDTVSYKSWMTGVAIEANLTPRLRIGTGLNYRTLNSEGTHTICLDFKDKDNGEPGQPPSQHEHDFEYTLNTAAGTVQMAVRAESDDLASTIPDTEKVEATIKTSEHLAFASIPFYANYSFGNGRLRVLAKAGIALNFLLDSDFSIIDIASQNDRFRFDRQKPQKGAPSDLQSLSASYMAGLGLEYQLTKSLSLRAEPTVMGSLTSLHNNPFIESTEISAGLNMGVVYSF